VGQVNANYSLTTRQGEALKVMLMPESNALMYGGAKGGGKSYFLSVWVFYWVDHLIKLFKLKPSVNPPVIGFIGRKQAVDFIKTTLETFKRVIPPEAYKIKEQAKEIVFLDTVKIWYGGLDDRETINKFNSAELAFCALDQAEECEREDVRVLRASLRFKIKDIVPHYKELYTANPADCWLREDFIVNKLDKHYYVPALPTDNRHLPPEYCDRLRMAFRTSPALLAAYLNGDWNALQATNAMFTNTMLDALRGLIIRHNELKRGVICDPSLGGDECVIYVMENCKVIEKKVLIGERDTMKIAGEIAVLGEKHHTNDYALDIIGIGRGIGDRLRELNKNNRVQFLDSSEGSFAAGFANRRAEMWWYAMEQVIDKKIPFPEHEDIREQLCAVRFKVQNSNGDRLIEPKADVKKRIGRSPDNADCWVYGVWATKEFMPLKTRDAWKNERSSGEVLCRTRSPMAV